ncbi:hypothetical protein CCACVL1_00910, partial [Corchorus capsularis]
LPPRNRFMLLNHLLNKMPWYLMPLREGTG